MSIGQTLSDQLRQINMDIAYAQYKDRIWVARMIIWLDGCYGIGKSVVADGVKNAFEENIELLDADIYFDDMIKLMVREAKINKHFPDLNGARPQNDKEFMAYFKKVITEKEDKSKKLLVDMALSDEICKRELLEALVNEGKDIIHIVLTAEKNEIKQRIKDDQNRGMKEVALNDLDKNLLFYANNYQDAMHIDTSRKNIEDVVREVIMAIKNVEGRE